MKKLTKREEEMMDFLWKEDAELTASEMEDLLNSDEWNHAAVFRTVKSLEKKHMIYVSGLERRNKQYARKFLPAVSQDEYYSDYLLDKHMSSDVLEHISAALIGRSDTKDEKKKKETIQRLERIISELQDE